ncbi:MAG: hypothetical protein M3430_07455 [Acidobacteriota bacterium]|nr:hypothetical protein [Acidobacteriota bacterium]
MQGFIRPDAVVLPESAMVPAKNIIVPAPNQFTHELTRPQFFYFDVAQQQGRPPDGELPQGTKVVLLFHDDGSYCRVADGRGLYVEVEHDALQRIRSEPVAPT